MDIDTVFADATLEVEGTWLDYRADSRVKLARFPNTKFTAELERAMRPHKRTARNGEIDGDTQVRILSEVMAATILLDWDGFTKGGKALKYSTKRAYDLLLAAQDFRNEITVLASDEANFHTPPTEAE